MTEPRLVAHATYARRPWRNGRGISRDIASGPGWQLSLADIERSGRFSDFAGYLRLFAIVAGAVVLHRSGSRPLACDPTAPVVAFDGGEAPDCEVVAGPARALNLIVPVGMAARLERLTLDPGMDVAVGSGDHQDLDRPASLVFVQSGAVACGSLRAGGWDSLVGFGADPGGRFLLRAVDGQRAQALVATIGA